MRKIKRLTRGSDEQPAAILTADWHYMSSVPICRTDNSLETQDRKVKFISDLAKTHGVPILLAGDIGEEPEWANWLIERLSRLIKENLIIAIPGQHDLPDHQLSRWQESAFGVLHTTDRIHGLFRENHVGLGKVGIHGFPYSVTMDNKERRRPNTRNIAMTHQLIIKDRPLWEGQRSPKALELLKRFSNFDLILSGDNHKPFVVKYKNRLLVNPGSIMRISADQIDHKPRVYLWYAKSNTVKAVFIPIEAGVVTRDHIEHREDRDERVDAYVTRMREDYEVSLSFVRNMEQHLNINPTVPEVKSKIWESMG